MCNKDIPSVRLGVHLRVQHSISPKDYYHLYLTKNTDNPGCKNKDCDKPVGFQSVGRGYNLYCSRNCANKCQTKPTTKDRTPKIISVYDYETLWDWQDAVDGVVRKDK